ncbi:Alcohol dehydrogenase [Burkholderiales bacterium 8X]|nr:Alcohol dehydrogenase [Burkholderiales bacterium 8X]
MRAVRVHAFNQLPVVEEVAEPEQRPGHSIVRLRAATVGHIDRTVWSGNFLQHPPLPYVPGVEGAGIVVSGERFAPGTRVWLRAADLGTRQDGTWRELVDAPDAALGLLPDGVDMATGSAFFSPCTSAWVALNDIARLQPGERVRITGASGAVGSIAVQLAQEIGAAVSTSSGPLAEGEAGVDLLLDTIGGPMLEENLRAVVPGGRAVLVGYTAGNELALNLAHFLQRDVALLPLNMFRREPSGRAAAPELLARLADGRLQLAVQTFALEEAARAMQWITERGHRGRAVLTV